MLERRKPTCIGIVPTVLSESLAAGADVMAAPQKPTEVKAKVEGSTVTVSWKAPAAGDAPTEYTIQRGTDRGDLRDLKTVQAPTTEYDDKGLGTVYYYTVVAKNADGPSDAPEAEEAILESRPIELSLKAFAGWALIVVGGLIAIHVALPYPQIPAPSDTLASISGNVGAFLVRFGVVLLVAAFIPALIELFARTFHIRPKPKPPEAGLVAAAGAGEAFLGVVSQLPELLKRPAGYGMALVLLGVLLLVGAAFGFGAGDAGAGASPSPGAESPAPGTPGPATPEPGATPT